MFRRLQVVITVAGAAAVLAACGGSGSEDAALPPGPSGSAVPASATPSASATPGADVLSSYLTFWDAVIAANRASDPALPALVAHSADPQLGKVQKAIRVNKTQGVSLRGAVAHKPTVASTSATAATVEDCYDVTGWDPVDIKTGKKIDVTDANGTGRYHARYTLRRSGGGWTVTDQVALGGC